MEKVISVMVLAAAVAASSAGDAGASRSATKAMGHSQRVLVIDVRSVQTAQQLRDVPPKGATRGTFSKGDTVTLRDRLVNLAPQFGRPVGATVGADVATVTFTSPTTAMFTGTAMFPGGSVKLRGRMSFTATGALVIPIVGGTGAYAGARGTASEPRSDSDPAKARNTYRLSLP